MDKSAAKNLCRLTLSSCTPDTWFDPWQGRALHVGACKSKAASTWSHQSLSWVSRLRRLTKGFFYLMTTIYSDNVEQRLASWWEKPALSPPVFETCKQSPHTCNPPENVIKVIIRTFKKQPSLRYHHPNMDQSLSWNEEVRHLCARRFPEPSIFQLFQAVLPIQVVAKAPRKSPKSATLILMMIIS